MTKFLALANAKGKRMQGEEIWRREGPVKYAHTEFAGAPQWTPVEGTDTLRAGLLNLGVIQRSQGHNCSCLGRRYMVRKDED